MKGRGLSVWLKGLRELVVIVAGVMIALFADGLREDWEEHRILSQYLGDVAAEIRSNGRTLDIVETRVLPEKADALARGYSGVTLDLFPGVPDYGVAMEQLRSRGAQLLPLAQTEAAYLAAWGHALSRYRRNVESMLDALDPWAGDEGDSGDSAR